jgi:hypothetical protein
MEKIDSQINMIPPIVGPFDNLHTTPFSIMQLCMQQGYALVCITATGDGNSTLILYPVLA